MKRERLHISTLIFGSVLAFAIAFSQFITPHISEGEEGKTEQTEKTPEKDTGSCISLASFSLPAPLNLQANLSPYCLFEIILEEDIDEVNEDEGLLHTDHFFQTMFRVIISPNAP